MIRRYEHTRVIRRDAGVLILRTATGDRQLDAHILLGTRPAYIKEGQLVTLSYNELSSGGEEERIDDVRDVKPEEEQVAAYVARIIENAGLDHVRGPHCFTIGIDTPCPAGSFDLIVVAALVEIMVPGARALRPWYLKDAIEVSFDVPRKESLGA